MNISYNKLRTPLLLRINAQIKQRPRAFGCAIAGVKAAIADFMVQTLIEKKRKDQVNWRRNVCFATFGLSYTGFVQYYIYCKLFPMITHCILHAQQRRYGVVLQVAIDQLIHSPFIYFPAFYCVKATIYEGTVSTEVLHRSLNQYFTVNITDDVLACMKLWIPAQTLTFTVIPTHLRLPWVAFVSFMWTTYLSYSRGN